MTKQNAKDFLPLVQALSEGKTIQILFDGEWKETGNPAFNFKPSDYRVKPEPREFWITRDKVNTAPTMGVYEHPVNTDPGSPIEVIHVREVV